MSSVVFNLDPNACYGFAKFRCKNGKCISVLDVCNSLNNCGDYSDELSTDSVFCGKFDSFYDKDYFLQNSSIAEEALKVETTDFCYA